MGGYLRDANRRDIRAGYRFRRRQAQLAGTRSAGLMAERLHGQL